MKKLEYYSFTEISNIWFASHLINRKQIVSVNGYRSNLTDVKCGMPQSFMLGPLFFLIYVNDLHVAINYSEVHHVADDTNLLNWQIYLQKYKTSRYFIRVRKIHKETRDGLPPFYPILSATGTPTYKLTKSWLKFLTHSSANKYTAIDPFRFAQKICQLGHNLHMFSLDYDSLFTNIPLDETIDICNDNLYYGNENALTFPSMIFVIYLI